MMLNHMYPLAMPLIGGSFVSVMYGLMCNPTSNRVNQNRGRAYIDARYRGGSMAMLAVLARFEGELPIKRFSSMRADNVGRYGKETKGQVPLLVPQSASGPLETVLVRIQPLWRAAAIGPDGHTWKAPKWVIRISSSTP